MMSPTNVSVNVYPLGCLDDVVHYLQDERDGASVMLTFGYSPRGNTEKHLFIAYRYNTQSCLSVRSYERTGCKHPEDYERTESYSGQDRARPCALSPS